MFLGVDSGTKYQGMGPTVKPALGTEVRAHCQALSVPLSAQGRCAPFCVCAEEPSFSTWSDEAMVKQ